MRNFWIELGQNYPFAPKGDFFGTFSYVTFVYLLSSIILQSFQKLVRVDPEILASIGFGQNWAKITHLTQGRIFLLKFSLM